MEHAQDRLVSATKGTTRLEFAYDYMGRRFEKKVYENNVLTKRSLYAYDGFKQIAEFDALDNNALLNTYLWQPVGLDVPLLRNGSEFYVSDANKKVVALMDTTGAVTDTYVYDPFGNCAHAGDSANPFRFSSEYHDDETGLVYYNYRYYSHELGRWIKRDPIGEELGLYATVGNNLVKYSDELGLKRHKLIFEFSRDQYNSPQKHCDEASVANSIGFSYKWANGITTVSNWILNNIRPYLANASEESKNCHCIEYIIIAQHSSAGYLNIGEYGILSTDLHALNDKNVTTKRKENILNQIAPVGKFLDIVRSKMCSEATIEFVECSAGEDSLQTDYDDGRIIMDYLRKQFPPQVSIILYKDTVYFHQDGSRNVVGGDKNIYIEKGKKGE